jgi:hypothetical protein
VFLHLKTRTIVIFIPTIYHIFDALGKEIRFQCLLPPTYFFTWFSDVEVTGYSVKAVLFIGMTSLELLQELFCDMPMYRTDIVMENDHVRTFHPDDFHQVLTILCSSQLHLLFLFGHRTRS